VVREGLPDFNAPAEKVSAADMARNAARERALIDDLEIVEPGRDPSHLFAEAERKAKVVNGHAKRVGPISGRVMILAPWIFVLVLSLLGFGIGAVEAMKGEGLERPASRGHDPGRFRHHDGDERLLHLLEASFRRILRQTGTGNLRGAE